MTHRLPLPNRHAHITQKVGDLFAGAKCVPCGPVVGHDRLKHCSSSPDLIGGRVLVQYCRRQGGPMYLLSRTKHEDAYPTITPWQNL
jgi:hypothetical protein